MFYNYADKSLIQEMSQTIFDEHKRDEQRGFVYDTIMRIVAETRTTFEHRLYADLNYGVRIREVNYLGHFVCKSSPKDINFKHIQDAIDSKNLPVYYHLTEKYCMKDGDFQLFLDVFMK